MSSTISWPEDLDEVIAGDQVVMLATVTPARGVVLAPVTNFATRDREAGTIAVNTSVGAHKKLERLRRDPAVALAFHTRAHGDSNRPEYVLVQGRATVSDPIDDYPDRLGEAWDRRGDARPRSALWRRWMRVYRRRVEIVVHAERIVSWPDLACAGTPRILGPALPAAVQPQRPPRNGTGPRTRSAPVARRAARLPHVLLGWVGADGLPVVVPVSVAGDDDTGVRVSSPVPFPEGGRRAGLTAHIFTAHVLGQDQMVMTGWFESEGGERGLYAPHTRAAYRLPASRTLYRLVVGFETRRRGDVSRRGRAARRRR